MCIPHAPNNSFKSQRREKATKAKISVPFNKKLLEPDPDFKDERRHKSIAQDKPKSLLGKLFSLVS